MPGHLARFHTTNTSNYVIHLFLAELTTQEKVLSQVLKCFEIRIHSHTKYRVSPPPICDYPKKIAELLQPLQTTYIPSHGTEYIIKARSLFHRTHSQIFFWVGLVGVLSPFVTVIRVFPAPSPCPTKALHAGSVCLSAL